jgi:hypothetical protein
VSGQLHGLHALPQGNNPRHPLNRRVGGPLCRTGCSGGTLSCFCRLMSHDPLAFHSVAWSLHWLNLLAKNHTEFRYYRYGLIQKRLWNVGTSRLELCFWAPQ